LGKNLQGKKAEHKKNKMLSVQVGRVGHRFTQGIGGQ